MPSGIQFQPFVKISKIINEIFEELTQISVKISTFIIQVIRDSSIFLNGMECKVKSKIGPQQKFPQ